jgi:hypothetical protein
MAKIYSFQTSLQAINAIRQQMTQSTNVAPLHAAIVQILIDDNAAIDSEYQEIQDLERKGEMENE